MHNLITPGFDCGGSFRNSRRELPCGGLECHQVESTLASIAGLGIHLTQACDPGLGYKRKAVPHVKILVFSIALFLPYFDHPVKLVSQ